MNARDPNTLRETRRSLTARLVALEESRNPADVAAFQRLLAAELLEAEAEISRLPRRDREEVRHHIRLVRAHGDALVWNYLHEHVIRQFRKGGPKPHPLSSQRAALQAALDLADEIARHGVVGIVTDLTSELRLGDIVVADDREAPTIIECKNKLPPDNSVLLGRNGRQMARLQGTAKYLESGTAEVHGESRTRLCLETTHVSEPQWERVRLAVDEVITQGRGSVHQLEQGVLLSVLTEGEQISPDLASECQMFHVPILGESLRYLDDDAPLMPPPLAWPLTEEARWRLAEGELVVLVILDANRFSEIAAQRGRTIKVLDPLALEVTSDGKQYTVSGRFIAECLYNFRPIEQQVAVVLEFVDYISSQGIEPDGRTPPERGEGAPSRVHHVASEEDLAQVTERSPSPGDMVMVSGEVLAKFAPFQRPRVLVVETGGRRNGSGGNDGESSG